MKRLQQFIFLVVVAPEHYLLSCYMTLFVVIRRSIPTVLLSNGYSQPFVLASLLLFMGLDGGAY
jgi:hypothetical protein